MGMTNEQYKRMLIDELSNWQAALEIAQNTHADGQIIEHIERQITRINNKLKV